MKSMYNEKSTFIDSICKTISLQSESGISEDRVVEMLEQAFSEYAATVIPQPGSSGSEKEKSQSLPKKLLLVPPDLTRMHSYAGKITELLYRQLKDTCQIDIMPALGTHAPMDEQELREMFGSEIPLSCFIPHRWRTDTVLLGTIPAEFVEDVSEGLMKEPIPVEINQRLLDSSYDLILSIGQVVPHEVVGMANYTKNMLVGCGGVDIINKSHMLGAVCGMEKAMGKDHSPVRKIFDYAQEHFLQSLPIRYILTVTTVQQPQEVNQEIKHNPSSRVRLHSFSIGSSRDFFEQAVSMSQKMNITYLEEQPSKVVVFVNEREFKSTWLANKAIYRTRMAIADGGELLILAPGVAKFGEDSTIDTLIRKYGYTGRDKILQLFNENKDLQLNPSAAAHLIHGSSEGRFSVTYAVRHLKQKEVEAVNFHFADYDDMLAKYHPDSLHDGWNLLPCGEKIYYISNPAVGLWSVK